MEAMGYKKRVLTRYPYQTIHLIPQKNVELLQYINDLHDQLKTKEDYIETIKEEVRCSRSRSREKSLVKVSPSMTHHDREGGGV